MTALKRDDSRKKKTRKSCPRPYSPKGTPILPLYIQITPSLTSSTRVAPKTITASVYRSSDSRSRIDVLLGLALACLTQKPKPLLLLKRLRMILPALLMPLRPLPKALVSPCLCRAHYLFKEMLPACLLLSHHQQMSVLIHPTSR